MVSKSKLRFNSWLAAIVAASLMMTACAGEGQQSATTPAGGNGEASPPAASDLSGDVLVDGSSTVFPISEAMAEEFQKANPDVKVTVGVSGTGGGFKKFCAGETDVTGASRPIKSEEIELCKKGGIEYVELPVAFDGLSVVVNPKNDFAQCLKVDELKKMWEPAAQGTVTNWSQIRDGFPDKPLALYGAGTDSGTYDYFTESIVGKAESRGDYTASEDDNVIVQGVSGDENGLGFFGYAYYVENKDKLKLVEIDGGNGCVAPSPETIADGSYEPLSRPEFIYVKIPSLDKPQVKAFIEFYIDPANASLIDEVGYVSLPSNINSKVKARLDGRKPGSVFENAAKGAKLEELLSK